MIDRLASPEFHYAGGTLHAESLPLDGLAENVGTPFFCYSHAGLVRNYQAFASGDGSRPRCTSTIMVD